MKRLRIKLQQEMQQEMQKEMQQEMHAQHWLSTVTQHFRSGP